MNDMATSGAFAPAGHAQRWLSGLPRRWGRNGFVTGMVLGSTPMMLMMANGQAANVGYVVAIIMIAGMTGAFGLLCGVGARRLLKDAFAKGPEIAVASVYKGYAAWGLAVSAVLFAIHYILGARHVHQFGRNIAEDIGYLLGFFGILAIVIAGVAIVSRRGLRRAVEKDQEERPAVDLGALPDPASAEASEMAAATSPHQSDAPVVHVPAPASKPPRFSNFFARHWRGELSLPMSYWGVSLLGNILAAVVLTLIGAAFSTGRGYDPFALFALFSSIWGVVAGVSLWQVVGTWRAATNYAARRAKLNQGAGWATAAKVMLVFGVIRTVAEFSQSGALQLAESYKIAFQGDPDMPSYSLRVMRNGTEIEVSGGFKYGLSSDFERVFKASPRIRAVHLTSIGGRIGEARQLANFIRSRGLTTYVSTHCESACTLAFAAGKERWIASGGKLGFHGPSFAGMNKSDLAESVSSWKADLVADGISGAFADQALAVASNDMWYPTHAQLRGANVITGVADGSQFAASGYTIGITQEQMADQMVALSAPLKAMKARLPDVFEKVARQFYEGYVAGKTTSELQASLRSDTAAIINAAKVKADDRVLIELGRVALDQFLYLKSKPEVCYRYSAGVGNVNVARELPQALLDREIALNIQVIETAAKRFDVDKKTIEALYQRLFTSLARQFGAEKLGLLEQSNVPAARYADYCALTIAMYQEILAMRPTDAALLFRDIEKRK